MNGNMYQKTVLECPIQVHFCRGVFLQGVAPRVLRCWLTAVHACAQFPFIPLTSRLGLTELIKILNYALFIAKIKRKL